MKKCKNCVWEGDTDKRFCPVCGDDLIAIGKPVVEEVKPVPIVEVKEEEEIVEHVPEPRPKRTRSRRTKK